MQLQHENGKEPLGGEDPRRGAQQSSALNIHLCAQSLSRRAPLSNLIMSKAGGVTGGSNYNAVPLGRALVKNIPPPK